MALMFHPMATDEEIAEVARMADEIWKGYWPAIIGQEQTDYMVEQFQSIPAITADIRERGYRYWVLEEAGEVVGYTSAAKEADGAGRPAPNHSQTVAQRWPKRLFISKIYLYPAARGRHFASRVIEFFEQLCREEGLEAMYLTVNRKNDLGTRAYLAGASRWRGRRTTP